MKVRSDIVLATFVAVIIVTIANYFIVPYERALYNNLESTWYSTGYPADESTRVVTTLAEIEAAAEAYEEFAIQVATDNIKATDYFVDLTNYDSGFIKMNPIISHFRVVLGKDYFDRLYVVELEDGNRVPVQMYGRALDFSEDSITLPVAECVKYRNASKTLTAIDEKYDLTAFNATSFLVDASGSDFCHSDEVSAKRDFVYYVNWGIIIGSVFIYAIYSTVKLVKYRKRLRQAC